jgi:hypothetical protein
MLGIFSMGIFSGHMVGRQAKCPYIMGPILPAGLPIYHSWKEKRRRSAEFGADDSACRIGTTLIGAE